jgi:hypothetical protein
LCAAVGLACDGERNGRALVGAARTAMTTLGVDPEYLELVDPKTLEPMPRLAADGLLVVAARVGDVRLIDNVMLSAVRAGADTERGSSPTSASGTHARKRRHEPARPRQRRAREATCSE